MLAYYVCFSYVAADSFRGPSGSAARVYLPEIYWYNRVPVLLSFQASEETLHWSVIPVVSTTTDAQLITLIPQHLAKLNADYKRSLNRDTVACSMSADW